MPGPKNGLSSPGIQNGMASGPAMGRGVSPAGRHLDQDITGWSTQDKLMGAMRRSLRFMPEGLRAQFESMISGENLEILAGTFVLWGVSHVVGIGEVMDVILALFGEVMMGSAAGSCAADITLFVRRGRNAARLSELDEAGRYLAQAVSAVGATAFFAIVLHYAGRSVPSASASAAASAEDGVVAARLTEAIPGKSPVLDRIFESDDDTSMAQAMRRAVMKDSLKQHKEFSPNHIQVKNREGKLEWKSTAKGLNSYLDGMKLDRKITRRTLEPGTEIIQYVRKTGEPGIFFARPGTKASELAILAGGRVRTYFRVTSPITVIETTADAFPTGVVRDVGGPGGGTQIIMPPGWATKIESVKCDWKPKRR